MKIHWANIVFVNCIFFAVILVLASIGHEHKQRQIDELKEELYCTNVALGMIGSLYDPNDVFGIVLGEGEVTFGDSDEYARRKIKIEGGEALVFKDCKFLFTEPNEIEK